MTDGAKPHSHRRNVKRVHQFFKAFPSHIAATYPHGQHGLHAILTPLVALCHGRLHEVLRSSVPDGLGKGNGSDGDQRGPKVTTWDGKYWPGYKFGGSGLPVKRVPI